MRHLQLNVVWQIVLQIWWGQYKGFNRCMAQFLHLVFTGALKENQGVKTRHKWPVRSLVVSITQTKLLLRLHEVKGKLGITVNALVHNVSIKWNFTPYAPVFIWVKTDTVCYGHRNGFRDTWPLSVVIYTLCDDVTSWVSVRFPYCSWAALYLLILGLHWNRLLPYHVGYLRQNDSFFLSLFRFHSLLLSQGNMLNDCLCVWLTFTKPALCS